MSHDPHKPFDSAKTVSEDVEKNPADTPMSFIELCGMLKVQQRVGNLIAGAVERVREKKQK